jgi:hypothetical protein
VRGAHARRQREEDERAIAAAVAMLDDLERRYPPGPLPPEPQVVRLELHGGGAATLPSAPAVASWLRAYLERQIAAGSNVIMGTRGGDRPYTPARWERLVGSLLSGGEQNCAVGVYFEREKLGEVSWARWREYRGWAPTSVINLTLVINDRTRLGLPTFIEACIELAELSRMEQGRVTTPGLPRELRFEQTPLEIKRRFGPTALARYVRGIGWALWLGEGLVERLGGRPHVVKLAPARRVVERPNGLWLEFTDGPLSPIPTEVLASIEDFVAPVLPTPADVITVDRTEADQQRIRAAHRVDTSLPFGFVVEGIFTHSDGVMLRGVVTHGRVPTVGTMLGVYEDDRLTLSAPLLRTQALDDEPLMMLTLGGLDARRVPHGARVCADPQVLHLPPPDGLLI